MPSSLWPLCTQYTLLLLFSILLGGAPPVCQGFHVVLPIQTKVIGIVLDDRGEEGDSLVLSFCSQLQRLASPGKGCFHCRSRPSFGQQLRATSLDEGDERRPPGSYRTSQSRNPYRYLALEVQRVLQRHFQWIVTEIPRVTR